jgi:hypothetical protein
MTRETRFNLIFLAILLAVLLPGAVMLFRRKLEPTVRPMYLPDPVRQSLAYMSPDETPPGMTRVAPPHAAEWMAGIVRDLIGAEAVRPRDEQGLPLTSRPWRWFEVVAYRQAGERVEVVVALWRPPQSEGKWTIADEPATIDAWRHVELPRLVREELGANGVLIPPKSIWVGRISSVKPSPAQWDVKYVPDDRTIDSANIVTSFTSPDNTSN